MRSYFFIPASLYANVSKILEKGVDEIVIDFEDSIKVSEKEDILTSIDKFEASKNYWFRIPLRISFDDDLSFDFMDYVVSLGYKKIVLPKVKNYEELKLVIQRYTEIEYILLIEHPRLLNQIEVITTEVTGLKGVALGSHDLMAYIGSKHSLSNLEYPRQKVLYAARASEIEAIDIASMELKNEGDFINEIKDGFEKGFDSKFFIHPWQLGLLKKMIFYTDSEIEWATEVITKYNEVNSAGEFTPVVINGQIIERPHLKRAQYIIEKQTKNEN